MTTYLVPGFEPSKITAIFLHDSITDWYTGTTGIETAAAIADVKKFFGDGVTYSHLSDMPWQRKQKRTDWVIVTYKGIYDSNRFIIEDDIVRWKDHKLDFGFAGCWEMPYSYMRTLWEWRAEQNIKLIESL